MNFVKSHDYFGRDVKEIPCITGSGSPSGATEGVPGCLYMNTLNGNVFRCVGIRDTGTIWESLTGLPDAAPEDEGKVLQIKDGVPSWAGVIDVSGEGM